MQFSAKLQASRILQKSGKHSRKQHRKYQSVSLKSVGKEDPTIYHTWYVICLRIHQTQTTMKRDSYFLMKSKLRESNVGSVSSLIPY